MNLRLLESTSALLDILQTCGRLTPNREESLTGRRSADGWQGSICA